MSDAESHEPASPDAEPPAARTVPRWSGADLAIGSALLVLVVSLFLPWYSGTVRVESATTTSIFDGPQVHNYLWLLLVLAVIGLGALVGRDSAARWPGNLPSPGQVLMLTSGIALGLIVVALVTKPTGYTVQVPSVIGQSANTENLSYGWSYGGFVAITAAVVALIWACVTSGPLQEAERTQQFGGAGTG